MNFSLKLCSGELQHVIRMDYYSFSFGKVGAEIFFHYLKNLMKVTKILNMCSICSVQAINMNEREFDAQLRNFG